MDRLTLKSLQYTGYHGVYEEERRKGNRFEVDVTIYGSFSRAAETDRIQETLDYQRIEQACRTVMTGPSRKLIETLCLDVGKELVRLLPQMRDLKFDVTVRKLTPALETRPEYSEIRLEWPRH